MEAPRHEKLPCEGSSQGSRHGGSRPFGTETVGDVSFPVGSGAVQGVEEGRRHRVHDVAERAHQRGRAEVGEGRRLRNADGLQPDRHYKHGKHKGGKDAPNDAVEEGASNRAGIGPACDRGMLGVGDVRKSEDGPVELVEGPSGQERRGIRRRLKSVHVWNDDLQERRGHDEGHHEPKSDAAEEAPDGASNPVPRSYVGAGVAMVRGRNERRICEGTDRL